MLAQNGEGSDGEMFVRAATFERHVESTAAAIAQLTTTIRSHEANVDARHHQNQAAMAQQKEAIAKVEARLGDVSATLSTFIAMRPGLEDALHERQTFWTVAWFITKVATVFATGVAVTAGIVALWPAIRQMLIAL